MQLQRQESRKSKGKKYDKWVITIPPSTIKKINWKEGEELKIQPFKSGLIIFSASLKKGKKEITYKENKLRIQKYTPVERFLKIYNNLPLSERSEVVVIMNSESITWQIARNHISHNTDIGKKIIKALTKLKII